MKTLPLDSSPVNIVQIETWPSRTAALLIHRATPACPPALAEKLQKMEIQRFWAIGNRRILDRHLLGFICSSRCQGQVILRIYDLARELRDAGIPIISGFHSPMEKECLYLLLRGDQPVVICPGRGIDGMRLSAAWRKEMSRNRLLLLSPFEPRLRRPTKALAEIRNRFVAMIADSVLVAHAEPGSKTERLCLELLEKGKSLYSLGMTENNNLIEKGALGIGGKELPDFFSQRSTKA
jgi:predicted Rossmann fold nucleotide-binding protein DprA/Smf involved in DNA uptake